MHNHVADEHTQFRVNTAIGIICIYTYLLCPPADTFQKIGFASASRTGGLLQLITLNYILS
jgi:hypothetical protein